STRQQRTTEHSLKKHLIALNMARESRCLVEGRNDSTWLRPQRRHFPQKPKPDSGRSSWAEVTSLHHKEKRHFAEISKFIYNRST
uniref:Uncharacterized protein n=1 Tax=Dromaius novaehollandiae TaxID=8790 RepID=A0A8C4J6T8_DRONO